MNQIIGLAGYRGVGKSTVRKLLVDRLGYVHKPFAGPLKSMLRVLGLTEEMLDGDQKEEPTELLMGHTPRHAMQTLGTEWGRDLINQNFWLHCWRRSIIGYNLIVVDDVRFENEAAIIKELGGVVIRLQRPGFRASAHISEHGVDLIRTNITLVNAGSPDDLLHLVITALGINI
jgi:hypothetical protein